LATNVDSGSLSGAYPKTIADQEFNAVAAVVVAQLVERSLPTPEVRSSNPVIGKIYVAFNTVNCIEKFFLNPQAK